MRVETQWLSGVFNGVRAATAAQAFDFYRYQKNRDARGFTVNGC